MVGDRIKKLRESRGLSLTELAERAGVAKSYLSTIERNLRSNPSIQFIEKVAEVLNVSVTSLIDEDQSDSILNNAIPSSDELDSDWIKIVKEAMDSGVDKDEFKAFLEFQKWRKSQD
ncbi:helix-turn-helix domain-containing protein [Pullulanibacillus sp. KACC 23026]|uniref:helix-turn-helix domain-containing protein n=1 Tax=Pullulanibacillus sp. KACC 23026 TaxID=3028315 RepID=UPI0023B024FB|nr:helix-turn-helix domain-containing protein [Pullulanibacillus sp. KACC 23026]WEG11528.1 helix-turn-helix domain-containing protein [Pullulanibacillus sp. KACC 23026]